MTARELADILMKAPDAEVRFDCEVGGYDHEIRVAPMWPNPELNIIIYLCAGRDIDPYAGDDMSR